MKELQIILDNGHAKNTAGKCSPDKSFYEWKFNRDIAISLEQHLKSDGYSVHRIVTEDIHHILGILKYPDLAYNTDNLLALCKECHSKIHSNHKESELENIYYERVANNT